MDGAIGPVNAQLPADTLQSPITNHQSPITITNYHTITVPVTVCQVDPGSTGFQPALGEMKETFMEHAVRRTPLFTALIAVAVWPQAVSAEQVGVTDDGGRTNVSTWECTSGHPILTRQVAPQNAVQRYVLKYTGCTDPWLYQGGCGGQAGPGPGSERAGRGLAG